MHVKIQTSPKSNSNKGSSVAVFNYLEKEDLQKENEALRNNKIPDQREAFFDHKNDRISKTEAIQKIDSNNKGVGKDQSKFYTVTFSPSSEEQKDLIKKSTGKNANSIDELSKEELKNYEKELQKFTRSSMNEYSTNFTRKNPLKDGNDLVYAAKIEHTRTWKGIDKEVKNQLHKSGEKKGGLNSHIHVVVSRKDINQKTKLSPMNTRRKEFNLNQYKVKTEKAWDKQTGYNRRIEDRADYQMAASKDKAKSTTAELTTDPNKKLEIQKEMISEWNDKNQLSENNKELVHDIKPSFKEEEKEVEKKQPEQNQNRSNDHDQEIEY